MLDTARVAARLPVQNLERARALYSERLGLDPLEERDGGLLYPAASGEFASFESAGASPGTFTQIAWEVDDIESTVAELRARGRCLRGGRPTRAEDAERHRGDRGPVWKMCGRCDAPLGQRLRDSR
jgi:catechol 2,3-dioxygenase-like lactoylglutathione lyase family enzyme